MEFFSQYNLKSNCIVQIEFDEMSEVVASRMSRATRGLNESYIVLLLLTWNDTMTNGGKQLVTQLEQTMKVRAANWIKKLYIN